MSKLLLYLLAGLTALPAAAQTPKMRPNPGLALAVSRGGVTAANPFGRPAATTRLVRRLEQTYYQGAWVDTIRISYSRFTPANHPRTELWEQAGARAATPFKNLRLQRYTINAAEQTTLDTTFTYPPAAGPAPGFNQVHTYNAQGRLAQTVEQIFSAGSWSDYARDTYTYNAAGLPTNILHESHYGSTWENSAAELLTYDAQGRLLQNEYLLAQPAGPGFEPFYRGITTYDANGRKLTYLNQYFSSNQGGYADIARFTFSYNAAGQLELETYEENTTTTWRVGGANQYSYDADGNVSQLVQQLYAPATSSLVDYYRIQYTYERVTATAAAQALAASLRAVPNPAAPEVAKLCFQLPTATPATVEVLDLTGRVLARQPAAASSAAQTVELAPLGLRPGLYRVRLSAAGRRQQTRLVVQ